MSKINWECVAGKSSVDVWGALREHRVFRNAVARSPLSSNELKSLVKNAAEGSVDNSLVRAKRGFGKAVKRNPGRARAVVATAGVAGVVAVTVATGGIAAVIGAGSAGAAFVASGGVPLAACAVRLGIVELDRRYAKNADWINKNPMVQRYHGHDKAGRKHLKEAARMAQSSARNLTDEQIKKMWVSCWVHLAKGMHEWAGRNVDVSMMLDAAKMTLQTDGCDHDGKIDRMWNRKLKADELTVASLAAALICYASDAG